MNKTVFLTSVAEVMKGMISYQNMMASLQRSCMRAEADNLELMRGQEGEVDHLIESISTLQELEIPEMVMDVLVLRYLKNTQFLAKIKEDDIDVAGIEGGELGYWKKTMLYKTPL